MSAGTRAAAQKTSLQQRLAGSGGGGGDDGGDGPPELEAPHAKTSKTTKSFEKRIVYAAMTNAEPEVAGRYNHILVIMPPGLAVGITASKN